MCAARSAAERWRCGQEAALSNTLEVTRQAAHRARVGHRARRPQDVPLLGDKDRGGVAVRATTAISVSATRLRAGFSWVLTSGCKCRARLRGDAGGEGLFSCHSRVHMSSRLHRTLLAFATVDDGRSLSSTRTSRAATSPSRRSNQLSANASSRDRSRTGRSRRHASLNGLGNAAYINQCTRLILDSNFKLPWVPPFRLNDAMLTGI